MYDKCQTSVNVIAKVLALAGWNVVIPFNPKRVALILTNNGATPCVYSFGGNVPISNPAAPPGITVNGISVVLTRAELGSAIQQDLYASDGGIGTQIAVTEISDPWRESEGE